MTSQEFHDLYYDEMYDRIVDITMKDRTVIRGLFNDEFYEDRSILVSCQVIPIDDICKMELAENETGR